jgi:hypothetical protein
VGGDATGWEALVGESVEVVEAALGDNGGLEVSSGFDFARWIEARPVFQSVFGGFRDWGIERRTLLSDAFFLLSVKLV